jgi:hypothetical protein
MKMLFLLVSLLSFQAAHAFWDCQYSRESKGRTSGRMNFSFTPTHLKHGGEGRGHGYIATLSKQSLTLDAWLDDERQTVVLPVKDPWGAKRSPASPSAQVKFKNGSTAKIVCN